MTNPSLNPSPTRGGTHDIGHRSVVTATPFPRREGGRGVRFVQRRRADSPARVYTTARRRRSYGHVSCSALVLGLAALAGCMRLAAPPSDTGQPLATSIRDLVPHGDRDHLVFVWLRLLDGKQIADGIQVEHTTALGNRQYETILSENGAGISRTRFEATERAISLLSEEFGPGIRITYDPPLPYLEVPLWAGERRTTTTATMTSQVDGKQLGVMPVTQVLEARRAGPVRSRFGPITNAVRVYTARTLDSPDGQVTLQTTALLAPGLGEIRAEGRADGSATLYRELACATISGHAYGDCHALAAMVEELKRAGPTDIR